VGASEVSELAEHFNQMVGALSRDRGRLEETLRAYASTNLSLQEANESLHQAQDQLRRAERLASVGQLAAGIAHEVGNPLASILAYLELLRDPDNDAEETADFIAKAEAATSRIQVIIRDLLDYSRTGESQKELMSPRHAIDQAVALVRPQRRLRQVSLMCDLPEALPLVLIDEGKLTQLLVNWLLNAADALADQPEGRIEIRAEVNVDRLGLKVLDNGPGMSAEVQAAMFQPFFTTKDPGQGTGLGLAICEQIAELLGGVIEVQSAPGEGAAFVLWLPVGAGMDDA